MYLVRRPPDSLISARDLETIVLLGLSTEVGIASTAYAARDRDYNLVIVRDACWSRRPVAHDVFMHRVFPCWPASALLRR